MYLDGLYKEMNATKELDKICLANLVLAALRDNPCGVTEENQAAVYTAITEGFEDPYLFGIVETASYSCNDLLDVMDYNSEMDCDDIFRKHIWPYLTKNEVVPGVRMQYDA